MAVKTEKMKREGHLKKMLFSCFIKTFARVREGSALALILRHSPSVVRSFLRIR